MRARNPYHLSLESILEKLYFISRDKYKKPVSIIAEARGKKEDKLLTREFKNFMTNGTRYLSHRQLQKYIVDLSFREKSKNINGLQLADLSAYPIMRSVRDQNENYLPFQVLKPKLYQHKIFPKK